MNRRDGFIQSAMAALIASENGPENDWPNPDKIGSQAVRYADAAITAADRDHPPSVLEVLKAQHTAIDQLFAHLVLVTKDRSPLDGGVFYPTKSGQPWEACKAGNALIKELEGRT